MCFRGIYCINLIECFILFSVTLSPGAYRFMSAQERYNMEYFFSSLADIPLGRFAEPLLRLFQHTCKMLDQTQDPAQLRVLFTALNAMAKV